MHSSTTKTIYWTVTAALIIGLLLSFVSASGVCSKECSKTHDYLLCGCRFEPLGILFFSTTLITHLLSLKWKNLRYIVSLMIATAVGAEINFILLQKYTIKHWCPVCLSIAASVAVAASALVFGFFLQLNQSIAHGRKGDIMNGLRKSISVTGMGVLGFLISFFGISQIDQLKASETTIQNEVAFGDIKSPIEIYFFTDWQCPACREIEPYFLQIAPEVMKRGKLTFVDFVVHPDTLNFIPYNLSFMIYNKPQYLQIRHALTAISAKTGKPSEQEVEQTAQKFGVKYRQLNYADVAIGQKYFEHLGKQFDIDATPTLTILNKETKKGQKLSGSDITLENINKAIEVVSKKK